MTASGGALLQGILAYLAVLHETGDHLLAGLAFGIGLAALYLAHSELFTEGFLLPIMALFAGFRILQLRMRARKARKLTARH